LKAHLAASTAGPKFAKVADSMKKIITLFVAVATATLVVAFTVPGPDARQKAVGSLLHLSPELKAAFEPGDDFKPIPQPGRFDWLEMHEEKGQTYLQFLRSGPNRPGAGGRKFIYLQPIGKFPDKAPPVAILKEYLEAYFHPMPVKLAPVIKMEDLKSVGTRGDQINCTDLLAVMQKRVPRDAYIVMGVTMKDLYPGPKWNFVFGMAQLKNRCGVFSFARYGIESDPEKALVRALKVISHETGHAFGIKHCIHFHCLMNGSNGMTETDRAPLYFCPACLRKLHWGLKFKPDERYQLLADFLAKNVSKKESEWFSKRAVKVK